MTAPFVVIREAVKADSEPTGFKRPDSKAMKNA
jgi:hypothetical protein